MKIPFSPPDITEEEVEQVAEALRSGLSVRFVPLQPDRRRKS